MKPYRIAIIGIGKISQDQHLPVIAKDPRFELAALVSQRGLQQAGLPTFRTPAELYAALPDVGVVATVVQFGSTMSKSPGAAASIALWSLALALTCVGALPPMVTVTASIDCLPLPAVMTN